MNTNEMSFRPDSYWPESLTPEQRLSRISGKRRQDIARDLYASHGFSALNEFLVKEGLGEEERNAWGAVGPWCMGGEYLPPLREGEVEIARISLRSVTADQISVRAQREAHTIHYRIVGEYEEDEWMRYQLPFETSAQPLSLAELINLIDGARQGECVYPGGIFTSSWMMMSDYVYDAEEIISFLSVESSFYSQIGQCYQELAWRWFEENVGVEDEA